MRWVLLVCVCMLVWGCRSGDFEARKGSRSPGEFAVSMSVSPSTLDPALSQDVPTNDLMGYVFEGLVRWSKDNRLEPCLAESWTVDASQTRITFRLKKAEFHDGRPLRAQDVKATWERNCQPSMQSPTPDGYLGDIMGASDVIAGKAAHIAGLRVVDDRTLEVTLRAPRPSFLAKLTYPVCFVLPEGSPPIDRVEKMIGTGPFRATAFVPEAEVTLARFERYHGALPTPEVIRMRIVKDSSTRVNLLRTGKLDWAGIPQADIDAFRKNPDFRLLQAERSATFYLGMNGKVYAPFADPRVRRAFNHAIDRARIVRDVLGGFGRPATGYIPPSVPQARGAKPTLAFNPAKARALLDESGWTGKLPPLELWVADSVGDRKRSAELAVSMLREHLGADVRLKLVESSVLILRATKREIGFFMGSWYMDYLDPENILSVLLSAYGQNRTNYDNPEFTRLCRLADAKPLGAERLALYREAEALAIHDAPWVPLYHPSEAIAVAKEIEGLESNAFGLMTPTKVRRKTP